MLTFILTRGHEYAVTALAHDFGAPVPPWRVLYYGDLFGADELPPGSYVFCDFERLSDLQLETAAEVYRLLSQAANVRCFNNPAKVKVRYALLRHLYEAGFNQFDVYRADGVPRPRRFPVFVRREWAHDAPLTPLLHSQGELDAALQQLPERGVTLRGALVIEFCGEPVAPALWRRYGTFNLGGQIHFDHVVSDVTWNVKSGRVGLVDALTYLRDDQQTRDNAFAEPLARAFAIAGIDYGRADFGLVGGAPQIYEINSSPRLAAPGPHPSPIRTATLKFAGARLAHGLSAMALPPQGPNIAIASPKLSAFRQELAAIGLAGVAR